MNIIKTRKKVSINWRFYPELHSVYDNRNGFDGFDFKCKNPKVKCKCVEGKSDFTFKSSNILVCRTIGITEFEQNRKNN